LGVHGDGSKEAVILGAGLAGLAAGCVLSRANLDTVLIERESAVGGLARTLTYGDFRFDIGGHRFITNNGKTEHFVKQILNGELRVTSRSSKILLRNRYFNYPLQPVNALRGLGIPTTIRIILDYAIERVRQRAEDQQVVSLEDWVVRHFGRTLFNIYFKEYSEKIWGIDCNRICKQWVEHRIQGLSLGVAIKNALLRSAGTELCTLASKFLYPPLGIGQIAENMKMEVDKNNSVLTNANIVQIDRVDCRIKSVTVREGGQDYVFKGRDFLSSIPLTTLIQLLRPRPPQAVLDAASALRYRGLVIVTIMLNRERVTDQTWVYIPEKNIPFGRIHEPTNWSREMAPAGKTLLVTEHFCFRGDAIWSASDHELTESTVASLVKLGFINRAEVIDSVVLRVPEVYPLFEIGYMQHCRKICDYVDRYSNLHLIGRSGLFKYYNMDHAIESGMAAAEELLAKHPGSPQESVAKLAPTGTHT